MTRFRIAFADLRNLLLLLAVAGGVGFARSVAADPVAVTVTESSCEPNEMIVPGGRVTFAIRNSTARALEWEILDGVMVVDERENIPPGHVQSLTAKLTPGDYQITCGFLSNPKGRLHVAPLEGAPAKVSQIDLIGPLAEYRVFASYEIDGLVDDTRRLADAVKSGDLKMARASYSAAHLHYARIAPLALFFPDLDGDVDRAEDRGESQRDPAYMGFRQLAWELFANQRPRDLTAVAAKLVADTLAMQARFENLPLTPAPTIAGAVEAIGGIAPAAIGGDAEGDAVRNLSDLRANIEGVRKIVDLFHPLIDKADSGLCRALGDDFSALVATLAKYQNANGALDASVSLSAADRTILQTVMKKLAGELGRLPAALGTG